MKKLLVLLAITAAFAFVFSSCKETLPKRFEIFVNQVEKRYTNFSEDDWAKANEHFEKLVKEYQDNKSSFNSDEKKMINESIGRYASILTKAGINTMGDFFKDALDSIGGFLKGIGLEKEPKEE